MCPYEILGIDEWASLDEVRRAYRALSLRYHPDRYGADDCGRYAEINNAYEVLSDEGRRAIYDARREVPKSQARPKGSNDEAREAREARREVPKHEASEISNVDESTSRDLLRYAAALVTSGDARNGAYDGIADVEDLDVTLRVTMEQAYRGCTLPIRVEKKRFGCAGGSTVETIYVDVPRGIDHNEVIRVARAGHVAKGRRGDVCVRVQLEPMEGYERSGLDVLYAKNVSLREAICGVEFEMSLFGRTYMIRNDEGCVIGPGQRRVIRGKGFERGGHLGDLIIVFQVRFPTRVSAETCEAIRALADVE